MTERQRGLVALASRRCWGRSTRHAGAAGVAMTMLSWLLQDVAEAEEAAAASGVPAFWWKRYGGPMKTRRGPAPRGRTRMRREGRPRRLTVEDLFCERREEMTTKHDLHSESDHENPDEANGCQTCRGGLAHCKVCGGAEGDLPTDCPGERMTDDQRDRVMAGKLDFVGAGWVVF